jgi:curved DNA-binding protein CbpA
MTRPYLDPYAVLHLERTASAAEIKKAYFSLVREHPPERDPDMFKQIRAAYERLRDPEQRTETDMLLLRPPLEPTRKRRVPRPLLEVQRSDVLEVARALSDLERKDWREYHQKVKL